MVENSLVRTLVQLKVPKTRRKKREEESEEGRRSRRGGGGDIQAMMEARVSQI
jgi:hypothetical protein